MAKKVTNEDEDQTAGKATEFEEDEEDETAGKATESEEDGEDEEDEDDEEAVLATLSPAQAKVFARLQGQLNKANASSARRRKALQAFRRAQGSDGTKTTGPKPGPTKTEDDKTGGKPAAFDPEAFRAQLVAEIRGEQQAGKVQTTAEKALRKAGLILPDDEDAAERKLARVLRMLDLEGVEIDEVADEVADLKRDNPELFGKAKKKRPAAGGVGGPARVAGSRKVDDKLAELFD